MKRYPFLFASLIVIASLLPKAALSQNGKPAEPAPSTLPGATTEAYKTVGDVSLPLHIFYPKGHKSGHSRAASLDERMGVSSKTLSPYHNIDENQPPAIIFHGDADTTVPLTSAEIFAEKSQAKGNRCELVTYEGQGHGFFNYGRGDNSMFIATVAEMDRFLNSLGYLKGKPTVEKFMDSLN